MPTYAAIVRDGILCFPEAQLQLRTQWLTTLKADARVEEKLKKVGRSKSHQQVKCHWGLVVGMIKQKFDDDGVDVMGVPISRDQIQKVLYAKCGAVGNDGEHLTLSKMSTVQASTFFEHCTRWASSQLALYIPNPDPLWQEKTNGTH